MKEVRDAPSKVAADHGEVIVDGSDGITYSMTPGAAARTSARLVTEAASAKAQSPARHDSDAEERVDNDELI